MGSTWQTNDSVRVRGPMGKKYKVPFYIQFVPGNVVDVVTSKESLWYNGVTSLNSIIAIPHITDELFQRRASVGDNNRYYPLLRGMTEVPAHGDPVLLATIGGQQYYLGPLNTQNSPNWNDDNLLQSEPNFLNSTLIKSERTKKGQSLNFEKTYHKRLTKVYNPSLDSPAGNEENRTIGELHGDMIFEGRHGNSIRIGSRLKNPYIFISNGRSISNEIESVSDGSLFAMIDNGSLINHFGLYDDKVNRRTWSRFTLSSDTIPDVTRPISKMIGISNNDSDPNKLIYDYDKQQTLLTSDRITINSKSDDLYLSSIKDIHIGSGRHLTISTNNKLMIDSENIYIGSTVKGSSSRNMEPLVLGNTLIEVLKDLINCLSEAYYVNPAGAPTQLHDAKGTPLISASPTGRKGLGDIARDLTSIISSYHYIEPNDR